jgi:hypothetical protein
MAPAASFEKSPPVASRWRRVAAGILGGAVGGLTWGVLNGLTGLDIARALIVGAAAIGLAELATTYLRRGWQRGLGFGLVAGSVGAFVSSLLFAPDRAFLSHAFGIMAGALVGGFVYVVLRERGRWSVPSSSSPDRP